MFIIDNSLLLTPKTNVYLFKDAAGQFYNKVKLSDVSTLTLKKNSQAAFRRTPPIPQVSKTSINLQQYNNFHEFSFNVTQVVLQVVHMSLIVFNVKTRALMEFLNKY
jgi:hypothetical protein